MAETVRGINVVIGADTTKLGKALSDVESKSKSIQSELRQVDRLLKFDPSNTTLLAQKQQLLAQQIENTSEKLNRLKSVQQQVNEQFARGEISEGQYRAFQRELEKTEGQLRNLQSRLEETKQEQERIATSTKQLQTLFQATGKNIDDFANVLDGRLVSAIKSGTASSKQLDDAIEKIGQAALGTNVDLDKMKKALTSVDDGNSLKNVRKELKNLANEADEAEKSFSELGVELENIAGALVAGGGIAGAVEKALDVSTLKTKIDVTFEVPEESKKSVEEAVRTIQAYGVDAEAALEGVRRQWALNKGASDELNTSIAKGAAAIVSSYDGVDFTELIQETHEVASELKISNEDALALINSLLKVGFPPEQLDIIAEYGQQLQRAGYDAQEIQAIFAAGVETETWNIDNLLDGLKEGRIRLAEFGQGIDKTTAGLLKGTGISAKQLQEWGEAVAAGGEKGQKAMVEVAKALNGVKDETTKNALGVQIFGTMYEDQGQNIIDTLLNAKTTTIDFGKNQKQLNDLVSQMDASPAVQLQQAFADLKTASEPLLDIIADVVSKIAEWVSNNPTLAATIAAIASVIGILVGVAMALAPIFATLSGLAAAFGVSVGTIAATAAIVVAAIAGLIAIGILVYKNWDQIKTFLLKTWDAIKTAAVAVWNGMKATLTAVWNTIKTVATSVWDGIKSYFTTVLNAYKTIFMTAWNAIKTAITVVWNAIKNTASSIFSGVKNTISNIWNGLKSTTVSVWNSIKSAITSPIQSAKDKVLGIINTIKNAFTKLTLKIPKPKLPDIDVNWKKLGVGDLSVKIPTFSVNWHAVGGVFTKPVIFGNAGFGDVEEAIVPFEGRHARRIADLIAREMDKYQQSQQTGVLQVEVPVFLDGREVARGSYRYINEMQQKEQLRASRFEGR